MGARFQRQVQVSITRYVCFLRPREFSGDQEGDIIVSQDHTPSGAPRGRSLLPVPAPGGLQASLEAGGRLPPISASVSTWRPLWVYILLFCS